MDDSRTTSGYRSHSGLEVLSDEDCLCLLSTVPVGRLVYTHGGLPVVRLVDFVVDGDTIVFATHDDTKRRAAVRGDVVAFEADSFDLEQRLRWTVTVIGHLSAVSPGEAAEFSGHLDELGVPGSLIRLGIESIHGRRSPGRAQTDR